MLTTIEKILLLQDVDPFTLASADHLALLAGLCEELQFGAEQTLFQAGDSPVQLYLLLEGEVRLVKPGEGPVEVDGGIIGFWSCLTGNLHTTSATCLSDSQFLVIRTEDFLDVLMTEPGLSLAILQHHAQKHAE
jgi:CRP-like cAMP-binding protein